MEGAQGDTLSPPNKSTTWRGRRGTCCPPYLRLREASFIASPRLAFLFLRFSSWYTFFTICAQLPALRVLPLPFLPALRVPLRDAICILQYCAENKYPQGGGFQYNCRHVGRENIGIKLLNTFSPVLQPGPLGNLPHLVAPPAI